MENDWWQNTWSALLGCPWARGSRGEIRSGAQFVAEKPYPVAQAITVYSQAAALPAFVLKEACQSGPHANWVMIQKSSRVGTSPTSLQACRSREWSWDRDP